MPPRNVGVLSLDDLLKRRDISPLQLGLDTIQDVLARDLAAHNRLVQDQLATFSVTSEDIRRRYGVSDTIEFQKLDEFSRPHTQKVVTSSIVEFPMLRFGAAIGWTADFFRQKTVADMAMTQQAVERGHLLNIQNSLQAAMYGASNYTFNDFLDTSIDIGVKRFVNADGAPIPDGPNGEQFNGATHTHYLFSAGLTLGGAHALVDTVAEHHQNSQVKVFINRADEAAWRALADFHAYVDQRLIAPVGEDPVPTQRYDATVTDNRAIGIFGPAEVWTKPWGIPSYALALDIGPTTPKPLVRRVRPGDTGDLRTVATNVLFPLQAEYMQAEYGFGVWERTAGAVYYYAGGAVAYVEPAVVSA